jgi:hypothetical protein
MHVDWRWIGSIISDEVWGDVYKNGASDVPESKVSVPVDWWVQIGRTWGGASKVLGTQDDKLSKSLEKGFIGIISGLVRIWIVDGIKKRYMLKKDNMTRHIKFLNYWIKTTIPPFTFTITKKTQIADREDNLVHSTWGRRTK